MPKGSSEEGVGAQRAKRLGPRDQNVRHPERRDAASRSRAATAEPWDLWLQTLVDAIGQPVIATDLAGVVTHWNLAAEELYGWSFHETVGRPLGKLIVPATSAERANEIVAALARGASWTGEFMVQNRDGRVFPVHLTDTPILNATGALAGIVAITTDLSEPEEARAGPAELAAVVEASENAIISTSANDEIRTWNAAAERMFGYSAAEAIGQPISILMPDEVVPEWVRAMEKVRHGRSIREGRSVSLRKDGSRVEVAFSAAPILSAGGTVAGIASVTRDVTAEVAAQRALSASELRFRRLFAESPVSKVLVDHDSRIVNVNASFTAMLGYDLADVSGKSLADITHPDDRQMSNEAMTGALRGHVPSYRLDKRFIRADGSLRWGRLTVSVFRDGKGEVELGLCTIEDITEQVETRQLLADREAHLRMALQSASMWTFDCDLVTRHLITGQRSAEWGAADGFGLPDSGPHDDFLALIHPDDRHLFSAEEFGATGDDGAFVREFRLNSASGTYHWIEIRGRVSRDAAGHPVRLTGTGMDITREKLAESRRVEAEEVLRRTVHASKDAYMAFDASGVITEWNPAAERIFGWTHGEACGKRVAELVLTPNEWARFDRLVRKPVEMEPERGLTVGPDETMARHRDGNLVLVEVTWVCVHIDDDVHFSAFARDMSDRRALHARLERQALTDALTGLPNRSLLHDRLGEALARLARHPGFVGVLFLDVDRFKVVNDSLGHDAGDDLLRMVGQHISTVVRPGDTLSRFGGDEFVIVPQDVGGLEDLIAIARRILAVFSEPVRLGGFDVTSAASIGIALTSDEACTPESLLRDADLAMYRAKARGGGAYAVFDEEMHEQAMTRLEHEAAFRRAIGADELRVHYQPYVSPDGRIVGVEALVRWASPHQGLILPADFIMLAEESGLIVAVGAWVLREACAQVAAWRAEGNHELGLSVNLSVRQLADAKLPSLVADTLAETKLDPSALCLEITETTLMRDPAAAAVSLKQISDFGVRIVVDDFGTGYASLLYIRRFPVQALKLDRCFVAGLGSNPEDAAIAKSVIDLAHALGLQSIAEGVETENQLRALVDLGCDFLQGYYWSPAVDGATMAGILRRGPLLDPGQPPARGTGHLAPETTEALAGRPFGGGFRAKLTEAAIDADLYEIG